MALSQQTQAVGCCKFLRWPSRRGYRVLTMKEEEEEVVLSSTDISAVRVVVGKEKRLFLVEPFVLEKEPLRLLMEMMMVRRRRRDDVTTNKAAEAIFVDVDSILFEHMLWLVYNNDDGRSASSSSSTFHLNNLGEIIDFYSDQDY